MRRWIKVYPHGILHGSIVYQLSEVEQLLWLKLLCYAGEINRDGQISDNDGRPLPPEFIAHELHCSVETLNSTINKSLEEGRITEDEHGLHITNWAAYQSEYNRQKPYREAKKVGASYDEVIGTIRVGGETLNIFENKEKGHYYIDAQDKKVFVRFDNKSRKYKPV